MSFHLSAFISTIALLVVLGVNYSVGQTLGNLDQIFPFLTMPPGITFAVSRSVIYLSLTATVISRRSIRVNRIKKSEQIMYLFWASCFFNISRIMLTYYEYYLFGVGVLIALSYVLYRIVHKVTKNLDKTRMLWIVRTAFALYLGWILVATIAIGSLQVIHLSYGPEMSMMPWWSLVSLLSTILVVGYIINKTTREVSILPIWALAMIMNKSINNDNNVIAVFCFFGIIILVGIGYHQYCVTSNKFAKVHAAPNMDQTESS